MTRFELMMEILQEVGKMACRGEDHKLAYIHQCVCAGNWASDDRGGFYEDTE